MLVVKGIDAKYRTSEWVTDNVRCGSKYVSGGMMSHKGPAELGSCSIAYRHGNCAVYTLSRQDLRQWYYVDKLTPTELQQKYLDEHGVFAHRSHLITWLKAAAQKPQRLENNESIHSHVCGEFVLELLQNGKRPEAVITELFSNVSGRHDEGACAGVSTLP